MIGYDRTVSKVMMVVKNVAGAGRFRKGRNRCGHSTGVRNFLSSRINWKLFMLRGFGMNWTTTKVPLWQIDCENFRRTMRPFELRDVIAPEHLEFVQHFAARYELEVEEKGTTMLFRPKVSGK